MKENNFCLETAYGLDKWLLLLIIVPSIINVILLILLGVSIYLIRKLHSVSENISASSHWLMRTAVRVGLGSKAKHALLEYAKTKPNLVHLVEDNKKNE